MSDSDTIDGELFRQVASQFVTGVTVIIIEHGDDTHGMTANSFTSVSLDPPLLLFCVAKTTRMASLLEGARGFTVNILSSRQESVSRLFAGSRKREAARTVPLIRGPVAPLIEGSLASISCETNAVHDGGDHWIVVGRAVALHIPEQVPRALPLVFFRSRYCELIEPPARPVAEAWMNDAIRVYHDEWSAGDGDAPEEAHAEPW